MKKFIDAAKIHRTLTNEELVDLRKQVRTIAIAAAEKEKKKFDTPPLLSESDVKVYLTHTPTYDTHGKEHTGPQTADALMDAFHTNYNKGNLHSEADGMYPPKQWIQMLLDKGLTIQNAAEYAEYMTIRWDLIDIENDPQFREMRSRGMGISESDIDTLKTAHLEKEINFKQRLHNARRADERIHFIGFAGPNNETELPFYVGRKMTYVQHGPEYTVSYTGVSLTKEQQFDLLFRAIEPEGIEIIYIDELGKSLEEKPPPFKREEFLKMMTEGEKPPPKEWWDPNAPIPDAEDFEEFLPPERDTELDFEKQRAREEFERHAAEIGRQPEFEQFMQEVRQLEKFATMSDAEIAAQLEKQLRQQLLPGLTTEESLEDALHEKITQKPLTPERFNMAKQILQNYGPKEGLRRLAKNDPELAEYFRRNPQKVTPKRSQHSNAEDSEKE